MSDELRNDCSTESCTSDCSSCGCSCGSAPAQPQKVTLTLDDGTVVTCAIITTFAVEENNYIVLLPLDENGENESGDVYIYRMVVGEDGQPYLSNIETDEEYEKVSLVFGNIIDQMAE